LGIEGKEGNLIFGSFGVFTRVIFGNFTFSGENVLNLGTLGFEIETCFILNNDDLLAIFFIVLISLL
jgi:hypothetical protein